MISASANFQGPQPVVTIDGEDIECAEVYITHRRGEFPRIAFVLDASELPVSLTGKAQIIKRGNVADFLNKIKPNELEAKVMENTTFADNIFAGMLQTLREMANAES